MSRKFGFKFCETIDISHFEWNMVPLGVSSKEEISGKAFVVAHGTRVLTKLRLSRWLLLILE
jgi:hypothetical protein